MISYSQCEHVPHGSTFETWIESRRTFSPRSTHMLSALGHNFSGSSSRIIQNPGLDLTGGDYLLWLKFCQSLTVRRGKPICKDSFFVLYCHENFSCNFSSHDVIYAYSYPAAMARLLKPRAEPGLSQRWTTSANVEFALPLIIRLRLW